jgi:hypothetical protein
MHDTAHPAGRQPGGDSVAIDKGTIHRLRRRLDQGRDNGFPIVHAVHDSKMNARR